LFGIDNDNIQNKAQYVTSNIAIFLNAKLLVASKNISLLSGAGTAFRQRGDRARKHKI